jgi:hypothetical protein
MRSAKAHALIEVVEDSTSPDGSRVLHYGESWDRLSRFAVYDLAHGQCEGCVKPHPVPWGKGDAHHRLGRGGGRRDDRPLRPMQPKTELNLARWRWFRGLLWCCRDGHQRVEALSTAAYKRGLMRFCECGLLVIS